MSDPPAPSVALNERDGTVARPAASAISVVVPCFNEDASLAEFHRRLAAVMDGIGLAWDVVFVNDGSSDGTLERAEGLSRLHGNVTVVNLTRNFGKEIALTAGLDHAAGTDAVVVIDADLQDPPEVIPALVDAWRQGFDMVYATRRSRRGDSAAKRLSAWLFYRLMSRLDRTVMIPPDTGDFRLLSRRALDALLRLRERHRFMKGLFAWVGYRSTGVLYDRSPRGGGRSSFNTWRLLDLAVEGITSFSTFPLKLASYLGLIVALFAIAFAVHIVFNAVVFGNPVPGYPSLITVVLMLGGLQLLTLGVIGEYLSRIFFEAKERPMYLVERVVRARIATRSEP